MALPNDVPLFKALFITLVSLLLFKLVLSKLEGPVAHPSPIFDGVLIQGVEALRTTSFITASTILETMVSDALFL